MGKKYLLDYPSKFLREFSEKAFEFLAQKYKLVKNEFN